MGQLNVKNEELEAMIKEASGPINFTVFLTMFGEKLKGKLSYLTFILLIIDIYHPTLTLHFFVKLLTQVLTLRMLL